MKTVLLAGGLGSRLSEETDVRPKPMVEIGGQPMLWHIMNIYAHHGLKDFIVCLGYKGYVIKEYFANFLLHRSDLTVDLAAGTIEQSRGEDVPDWRVTLVDTGPDTMTGGRLKRVRHLLDPAEPFCMTYGDGLADVDLTRLVAFHRAQGRAATVTAVRPPARYGATVIDQDRVVRFEEKPVSDGGWINGGFFVLETEVIDRIAGDSTPWEREPLSGLARDGQLSAFLHDGYWQPMDTLRERLQLEALWQSGKPPWKTW